MVVGLAVLYTVVYDGQRGGQSFISNQSGVHNEMKVV